MLPRLFATETAVALLRGRCRVYGWLPFRRRMNPRVLDTYRWQQGSSETTQARWVRIGGFGHLAGRGNLHRLTNTAASALCIAA